MKRWLALLLTLLPRIPMVRELIPADRLDRLGYKAQPNL